MNDIDDVLVPYQEENMRVQHKQLFWTYPRFADNDVEQQVMEAKLLTFKQFLVNKLENKPAGRGRRPARIRVLQVVVSAERHQDNSWHLHACAKLTKIFGRTNSRYFDFEDHHPNFGKVKYRWWHAVKYVIKDGVWNKGGVEDWDPEQLVADGQRKKSTSRHIVIKELFVKGRTPAQVLADPEVDLNVKASIAYSYNGLKQAYKDVGDHLEQMDLVPDIGWDLEDLPLEAPECLMDHPASWSMYRALIACLHPDYPRGQGWAREAIYVSGPRETGKSTLFRDLMARILPTNFVPCGAIKNSFWPKINVKADLMVLDEFGRGRISMMEWKGWCDSHNPRCPLTLEVKGDKLRIQKTMVWAVISNSSLDEAWRGTPDKMVAESERLPAVSRFKHRICTSADDTLFPLIEWLKAFKPPAEDEDEDENMGEVNE